MTTILTRALLLVLLLFPVSTPAQIAGGPPDIEPLVIPEVADLQMTLHMGKGLWGNDVMITDAAVYSYGKGQIASVADTLGNIYVGINEVYMDTLSRLRVYRSSDGGNTWSLINGFRFSGRAIQAFDMCISDSSSGKWVLGFAVTVKTDASHHGGGLLYWGAFLDDGSHWRANMIENTSKTTNFRNPSVCNDGAGTLVKSTNFYVAAEMVNPANDSASAVYINHSTDWGGEWVLPDSSLFGDNVEHPVIGVDWSAKPDTIYVAYSADVSPYRCFIHVARNVYGAIADWQKTVIEEGGTSPDCRNPSMAIDEVNGTVMVTYTRGSMWSSDADAMYVYSTNQFKTFVRDSIEAGGPWSADYTSVNCSQWGSTFTWRVSYLANWDTVCYIALANRLHGFYEAEPSIVNQFPPSSSLRPVVSCARDLGGTNYWGNCVYAADGGGVYFDATGQMVDVPDGQNAPESFALQQNYPNPFNPTTSIGYTVGVVSGQSSAVSSVRLAVFDVLGREVAVLADEQQQPGEHTVTWDASGITSGVYFYRLIIGDACETKKMLLLR